MCTSASTTTRTAQTPASKTLARSAANDSTVHFTADPMLRGLQSVRAGVTGLTQQAHSSRGHFRSVKERSRKSINTCKLQTTRQPFVWAATAIPIFANSFNDYVNVFFRVRNTSSVLRILFHLPRGKHAGLKVNCKKYLVYIRPLGIIARPGEVLLLTKPNLEP